MQIQLYKEKELCYDGTQLAPHWIYKNLHTMGDAVIAFIGEANVPLDHMVDLEDVKNKAPIYSPKMLHFLGEWFDDSLDKAILWQHLFVCELYETLLEKAIPSLYRRGNDIYYQERKLSVSIATCSPVSVLMHMGINIETAGTPIPTSGLMEMEIEPWSFAEQVLERFQSDFKGWITTRQKVRPSNH